MRFFKSGLVIFIFCLNVLGLPFKSNLQAYTVNSGDPDLEGSFMDINYFNVKMVFKNPVLYWSYNTKVEDKVFLVEKSTDGKNYNEIGRVKGTKHSNYSFVDDNPDQIINYYRFKKLEADSSFTVGPVKVMVLQDNSPYVITPCLVKKWITVCNVENSYKESVIQLIFANTGEVVYQTTLLAMNRSMQVSLSTLPAGDYVAKIQNGSRVFFHTFTKK